MVLNKKAIIFTLIAIGLSGLFVTAFSANFAYDIKEKNTIVTTRIQSLDQTIDEFYDYVDIAQKTAGYDALQAMYLEIENSGDFYIAGFESAFRSCVINADNCEPYTNTLSQLLDDYVDKVKLNKHLIVMDYTINDIRVVDEGYWDITIESEITLTLQDDYAEWNSIPQTVKTKISTIGINDPLFVAINDKYGIAIERQIASSKFLRLESGTSFETFMDFYTIGQYHFSENGPCLTQRFEGDFSTGTQGCSLETILKPDEIPALPVETPYMDWEIVNDNTYSCDELTEITSVNNNLILTIEKADEFGLEHPFGFSSENTCP